MKKFIIMAGLFLFAVCSAKAAENKETFSVVSLSPGVTEIIFALGKGELLSGVTRFCQYPPAARQLPHVGGYLDTNFEAIIRLAPDLVILRKDNLETILRLNKFGFKTHTVEHRNLKGVLASFETVAKVLGVPQEGKRLAAQVKEILRRASERAQGKSHPKILVSVSRDLSERTLGKVYVAGRDGYYNKILKILGARNAYEGKEAFPVLGREGLMQLQPDAVFELAPILAKGEKKRALHAWDQLPGFLASKNKKVFILGKDYVSVPGPRVARLISDFENLLKRVRKP